ncbi:15-hydroxyprostaglandin dehydrogenase [NAD(+)]-like isoform X1 [Pseudoliparis swirei]|uniref:15-hydroxyprostaglandin dehydrogenase [NAD(+)]-like isoform X1 n=1 Tax=Pseudoliparis swirei TaxID=2059687 RepID=UPI0024BE1E16|nr:15-hydroxyprostaglandin dehydrogenase [NAD(+)]-like isoform X1 [Pseudoliparis swirei]
MALSGQTAVVTGAAMGIGRAVTELLLQHGAMVALLDVDESAGQSLKASLDQQHGAQRTLFLHCSVESEEQTKAAFQKTVETFGRVDILCNNAGILNEAEWERSVSVNLVAVIRLTYMALEHMNKGTGGRGGVIVNIASMAGLGPLPSCPVYTATKHAVVGFTRAMAAASTALGYGIRFNAVCPTFVQTDLFSNIYDRMGIFSQLADQTRKYANTGVLNVSEVAAGLLELVTDETKNGEALMLRNGGKTYMTFPTFSW